MGDSGAVVVAVGDDVDVAVVVGGCCVVVGAGGVGADVGASVVTGVPLAVAAYVLVGVEGCIG